MKLLIIPICFLFILNTLNAQTDSLSSFTLSQLDSLYKTKKNPQEQLPYVLALLQKGEKELDTKDTAYAKLLSNAGDICLMLRDWSNASNYLEQAIVIWQMKMPMHIKHANCWNSLGYVYYYQGNYELTKKKWIQALVIKKEVIGEKNPEYAKNLNSLGILYKDMGNYPNAEECMIQALGIRKELFGEKHLEYAKSLSSLGTLFSNRNYEVSELYYFQALAIYKELLGEKHSECAHIISNLGHLYEQKGSYNEAEKFYVQALSMQKEVAGEKHSEYTSTINHLGNLSKKMGNYDKAEKFYLKVLFIKEEVFGKKHEEYALSLATLALLYRKLKNYNKAEEFYLQAFAIYKEVLGNKHPRFATALLDLGNLYQDMEDYDKAEKFYLEALPIQKEVLGDKHLGYATSLGDLGILYMNMKEYDKAEKAFLQSLVFKKELLGDKHKGYAKVIKDLGVLYKIMEEYDKAEQFQLEALTIYKKMLGEKHKTYILGLEDISKLYIQMAAYSKADSFYALAYAIKNNNICTNFAWLTERGRAAYWQQEKVFYQDLNNYAAQTINSFPQASVLAYNSSLIVKGLLLESAKEIEDAITASKDSVTLQVYEDLKKKRRTINHLVSAGTGKKEILDQYEVEADSLDKILVGHLGEYTASKRKFQITWKEVQNALTDNEIAIEFARYQNKQDSQYYYMALLLRKGYELPKLVKLGSEKAIATIPAGKGFADLYKLIWEPIDSFLNDVTTVYYSPDGVLNNIAFAALCSKGTEKVTNTKQLKRGSVGKTGAETENCTYLSERYTLHQVSITRYLAEGLKISQVNNSMLVFGGVDYDEIPSTGDTIAEVQVVGFEDYALAENIARSSTNQSRMEYLPGTQTELQNVQKILHKKQWKIRAFSDKNASENTLKTEIQKQSPSVLHIATHGFAFPDIVERKKGLEEEKTYRDSDNPMARCGLLLAGANHSWVGNSKNVLSQTGEDGILTALEVSNLPLKNTKLVVLSACETGLGKIQGTEGVFGLKRGFKLALVEQIIVSLWSVPDKETMELMDIFYNDLAKTHNAVISFEKAQKDMRKKYATRPDLWAGFVLVR